MLFKPMLAKTGDLPGDDGYAFEIKWDGIRAMYHYFGGQAKLLSRNMLDITAQYPELSALANSLGTVNIVLDGEIVAFGADGKPSFSLLQTRMGVSPANLKSRLATAPITYMIFDLLYLNRPVIDLPYTQRRDLLENLRLDGSYWQTPSFKIGNGQDLLTASRKLGLEGLIAKKIQSKYFPGKRTGDWIKLKNQQRQELVIGGYVTGQGSRSGKIGALLVGYYDLTAEQAAKLGKLQQLIYAGKVGTGFSTSDLAALEKSFLKISINYNPFSTSLPVKQPLFIQPLLVGEFEFTEWTPNNTLRHPSFKGLRQDKDPQEVIRESQGKE